MLELTNKMYKTKQIPAYFEIYNISNEKIEGLKDLKLLQLPRFDLAKFEKGETSKEALEEQYFRGLESRGQHLIGVDYGRSAVMVCGCKTYKHSDSCPMPYLKKYMKKKNFEIERYV